MSSIYDLAYSWFAPQSKPTPVHILHEDDYEVLETQEQVAAWFDEPSLSITVPSPEWSNDALYDYPRAPMPGLTNHCKKHKPKKNKAEKKAARHLRAMWP